jgi:hypothetical protein
LILQCQLSTENEFNVSGQKKKVRNTGKYSEKKNTTFNHYQSFRRATKRRQIFNIAGSFGGQMSNPVCSRVVGPAPKNYVLPSPIAPIFGNISSQWRRIDAS